jgi:hypothetical protein
MSQRKHPFEIIDDLKSDVLARSISDLASALLSTFPGHASQPPLMTRMRRISIQMEHTEVTISVTESASQWGQGSRVTVTGEPKPADVCPDCGARWLPNFQDVVRSRALTATQLRAAVSEGRLHLFCSPQNDIWICERSIQQMKENS